MNNPLIRTPQIIENIESSYDRRLKCWKNVSKDNWNNWKWQFENRLKKLEQIQNAIHLLPNECDAILKAENGFSTAISPHYASLIRENLEENCPIRRQCIPNIHEFDPPTELSYEDPLGEDTHAINNALIQRYPDRVLLYTTSECAMRCRHCTRRRKVGRIEYSPNINELHKAIDKIAQMPNIRDCLLSGGDPLILQNKTIYELIKHLKAIPHLDVIRLCTRTPVTLPQRIDDELCEILYEFSPIYLNTHFNHPFEATIESQNALRKLHKAGAILGNQMVLLKGINDEPNTVEALNRWLFKNACRPYYIFQLDSGFGTQQFQTPLQTGTSLLDALRGRLSGLAIPHFAVDLPQGFGKVTLTTNPILKKEGNVVYFNNWCNQVIPYRDC